jgi:hypothetical protein
MCPGWTLLGVAERMSSKLTGNSYHIQCVKKIGCCLSTNDYTNASRICSVVCGFAQSSRAVFLIRGARVELCSKKQGHET